MVSIVCQRIAHSLYERELGLLARVFRDSRPEAQAATSAKNDEETCVRVLEESPTNYIFAGFFVAILAALALYGAAQGMIEFIIAFIFFGAVAASLLYGARLAGRRAKRLGAVANFVNYDGSLSRELTVTPGYVTAHTSNYGGMAIRPPPVKLQFVPTAGSRLYKRLDWAHAKGYIVSNLPAGFYLWLPAYRVEDECCRGVYIVKADRSVAASAKPISLWLSTEEGDHAKCDVEIKAGVAKTTLEFWPRMARAARVELKIRVKGQEHTIKLAETKSGVIESTTLLAEGCGVYITDEVVNPPLLLKAMGVKWASGVTGVAPTAEYRVRLVVDRPMRTDVIAESPLEIY